MDLTISWTNYFEMTSKGLDEVLNISGVYEIWSVAKNTNKPFRRKYVGLSTTSIRERLLTHLSHQNPNENLRIFLSEYKAFVRAARVLGEDEIKQAEMLLYQKHHSDEEYIFNLVEPSGASGTGITGLIES